jgi:HNH endonuclease
MIPATNQEYVPKGTPIPGCPGYRATLGGLIIGRTGRPLKPQPLDGYRRVTVLDLHGVRRHVMVHRLVALTFFGPCPFFHEVNHINGDRACNWISNLEYVMASENVRHSFRHLGRQAAKGEQNGGALLTEDMVRAMRRRHAGGESAASIARSVGIDPAHCWRICTRRSWKHVRDALEATA